MNSTMQRKIGRILTVILLAVIAAGFIPDPSARNGSSLTLVVARAESAPAEFDVDSLAEILYLFDVDSRYARLKTRFIENFEKLPPENRNKVIQMYLGGKKEQPDQLKLMKGMSATASFLRGLETAQSTIKQYTETGIADEDADFSGIASGSAIVEYFPNSGSRIIPFLKNPNDIITLGDQITAIFKEIIAKNRARIAEIEKRIALMQEITDMINKALGK